jgi:hypothetical protein
MKVLRLSPITFVSKMHKQILVKMYLKHIIILSHNKQIKSTKMLLSPLTLIQEIGVT